MHRIIFSILISICLFSVNFIQAQENYSDWKGIKETDLLDQSEIYLILPKCNKSHGFTYISHSLKCNSQKIEKKITGTMNDNLRHNVRHSIDTQKYLRLWKSLLTIKLWELNSISFDQLLNDPKKWLSSHSKVNNLFRDCYYEFRFIVKSKRINFTVPFANIYSLRDTRYSEILDILSDFFDYEETIDEYMGKKQEQSDFKLIENEILEDSEFGYIEQFTGITIGATEKFYFCCTRKKCQKKMGNFFPDGSYKEMISEKVSPRKYIKLLKKLTENDIWKLPSIRHGIVLSDDWDEYIKMYGGQIPPNEGFNHIIFIRVKEKIHVFKVYCALRVEDKRYIDILREMNKVLGKLIKEEI